MVTDETITGQDIQDGSIAAADVQDGSLTGADIQDASIQGADLAAGATAIARDTAKASTSGVAVEFTNIPSWVRRITVLFNSVFSWASGVVPVSSTAGFPVFNNAASYNHYGELVLTNISGNTWVASGQFATAGTQGCIVSSGSVALAGALNYLRIVAANGTDAFDAGSINLLYE